MALSEGRIAEAIFEKAPVGGGASPYIQEFDQFGADTVDMLLPEYGLRAIEGRGYQAINGNGSTFLAPIVAMPTTTCTMALYNNNDAGLSFLIDDVQVFLASGTPAAGGVLLGVVSAEPQRGAAAPGAYANTVISNLSGGVNRSKAIFTNAFTLLIANGQPAWKVLQSEPAAGVGATIGSHGLIAPVKGRMLVPPGGVLGLAYLSGAGTTPLYGFGVAFDLVKARLNN